MPSGALDLLEYSAYWSTLTTRPTRVLGRPTGESGSCSGIFGILGTLQYVAAGELGLLEYSKYGSAGPARVLGVLTHESFCNCQRGSGATPTPTCTRRRRCREAHAAGCNAVQQVATQLSGHVATAGCIRTPEGYVTYARVASAVSHVATCCNAAQHVATQCGAM